MTFLDDDSLDVSTILAHRALSVVTRHADSELGRIQQRVERHMLVDGRADLEAVLGRLLARAEAQPAIPRTLDLIGHSTPDSLLQLGDWVIDSASRTVTAFFRELEDQEVLPRLGIHAVRLLGCSTAVGERARATLCTLADILGVEVYGTTGLLWNLHYDRDGFSEDWRFLLRAACDLKATPATDAAPVPAPALPSRRPLDIDMLPRVARSEPAHAWPRRLATVESGRELLQLVRRTEGATMPGLLAQPSCEVALPAADPLACYLVEVILDGSFVRVYPDGADQPGIVYPVTEAEALRALVERLPIVPALLPSPGLHPAATR